MSAASATRAASCVVAMTVGAAIGCGSSASDNASARESGDGGGALQPPGDEASEGLDAHGDVVAGGDAAADADRRGTLDATADGDPRESGAVADSTTADSGNSLEVEASSSFATIPLGTTDDSFVYEVGATIGNQTFEMDLDTGSTTVAVAAASCGACLGISPLYTPSSTATNEEKTASTQYEDQSAWSGEIYQDTVGLEYGTPDVSLKLAAITEQTQFFDQNQYQGIFGLGSPQNAEPNTGAYLSLVTAKGVVPVLGFELCATSGTMWLGGFDAGDASSAPQYTPLLAISDNNPFYAVNVDDLKMGGASLGFESAADFQEPIVDTGTSLLYFPTPVFDALLSAINDSSGFESLFPGQTLTNTEQGGCVMGSGVTDAMIDAALPAMSVDFPSATAGAPDFSVTSTPSQSYLYDDGDGLFCLAIGDGGSTGGATLGVTFIRAFVTVIDLPHNRVGFAPETGCAVQGGLRVIRRGPWHPQPPRIRR